jgi:hypothetical protein
VDKRDASPAAATMRAGVVGQHFASIEGYRRVLAAPGGGAAGGGGGSSAATGGGASSLTVGLVDQQATTPAPPGAGGGEECAMMIDGAGGEAQARVSAAGDGGQHRMAAAATSAADAAELFFCDGSPEQQAGRALHPVAGSSSCLAAAARAGEGAVDKSVSKLPPVLPAKRHAEEEQAVREGRGSL